VDTPAAAEIATTVAIAAVAVAAVIVEVQHTEE
jgi:hypothetical protein